MANKLIIIKPKELKRKVYKTEKEAKVRKNEILIPIYSKYRKIKVIDYCECCGHKTGFHFDNVPVGKPVGYNKRKKTPLDYMMEATMKMMLKQVGTPLSIRRLTGNEPVKFRRYSTLGELNIKSSTENGR